MHMHKHYPSFNSQLVLEWWIIFWHSRKNRTQEHLYIPPKKLIPIFPSDENKLTPHHASLPQNMHLIQWNPFNKNKSWCSLTNLVNVLTVRNGPNQQLERGEGSYNSGVSVPSWHVNLSNLYQYLYIAGLAGRTVPSPTSTYPTWGPTSGHFLFPFSLLP